MSAPESKAPPPHELGGTCCFKEMSMKPGPDFPTKCALCGADPAGGQATTYEDRTVIRLCHDDTDVSRSPGGTAMTCYHRWTVYGERAA